MTPPELFVSFSVKDKDIATLLAERLEQEKFDFWMCTDIRRNQVGEQWAETLLDALEGCEVMVLLYSKNAIESVHVRNEIAIALEQKKTLLGVLLDDSPFPRDLGYFLKTTQFLDGVYNQPADWLDVLIRRLRIFLPPDNIFPVNSIDNRKLKVVICESVVERAFGSSPVAVTGLGMNLEGMGQAMIHTPQKLERALVRINEELSACIILGCEKEIAVVSFLAKEDSLLAVGFAPEENEKATEAVSSRLHTLETAIQQSLNGVLNLSEHWMETTFYPRESRIREIEAFLTDLGKAKETRNAKNTEKVPSLSPMQTIIDRELNRYLSAKASVAEGLDFILPRNLSFASSSTFLKQLSSGKGIVFHV